MAVKLERVRTTGGVDQLVRDISLQNEQLRKQLGTALQTVAQQDQLIAGLRAGLAEAGRMVEKLQRA